MVVEEPELPHRVNVISNCDQHRKKGWQVDIFWAGESLCRYCRCSQYQLVVFRCCIGGVICVGTLGNHNVAVCWYWIYRRFHVEVWWYLCDRISTPSIGVAWIFYMGQMCTRINRVIVSVWRAIFDTADNTDNIICNNITTLINI